MERGDVCIGAEMLGGLGLETEAMAKKSQFGFESPVASEQLLYGAGIVSASQFVDLPLEAGNQVFIPCADGSLGFTVVGSLASKLFGR